MKTKEQLKEEIKQEAIDYDDKANILKIDELSEAFIEGALSSSSKAYWQNGMYTEQEVKNFVMKAVEEFNQTCFSGSFSFNKVWNENKKK